jgi:hypothetical protein
MLRFCAALLAAAAFAAAPGPRSSLPNGIDLPRGFPLPQSPTQRYRVPTYLTHPPRVIPIDIGRQLFVDDFLIESTTLSRTAHRTVMYPGNPVFAATGSDSVGLAIPYSDGIWYDPAARLFKMWYDGGLGNNLCYAWSKDGKQWVKPVVPSAAIPKSNRLLKIGGGRDSDTVWYDPLDPDPQRRYKLFLLINVPNFEIRFSPDGLRWSDPQPNNLNSVSDRTTVFWNPFRQVWVESTRKTVPLPATAKAPAREARARLYAESLDALHWSDPEPVFWTGPDELDPPWDAAAARPELYDLDAVAYESVIVGLFSWFHPGPTYDPKYASGPNLVEMGVGFSRDGFQWVRPTRGFGDRAFIPVTNRQGDWNAYNTQSVGGGFLVVGDQLWFYFSGRSARKPAQGPASTGLATLRRDGFYSMDARDGGGVLTTRPVVFTGRHLFVNATGELRAEIVDREGKPIAPFTAANSSVVTGDSTKAEITWRGGDLSKIAGTPVKLRFRLARGSLYSFWVTSSASGASHGYVAAGGPSLNGLTDD